MKVFIYLTLGIALFSQKGKTAAAVRDVREDTLLPVLTYGYSTFMISRVVNLVALKYGFYYHSMGGCVISPELEDSIRRDNKTTDSILEKLHGKGWQDRYNAEVAELMCYLDEATALVEKEPYIIQKRRELEAQQKQLYIEVMPRSADGSEIDASAYIWNSGTDTHCFEMDVNAVTGTVTLLPQKPAESSTDIKQ